MNLKKMYNLKSFIYIIILFPLGIFSQEKDKPIEVKLAEKQILRKGNDLYKENRFVDAEVKYKKALKQNPNYENAAYNLGNAVYKQNRFKEALPQYELVVKSSKDSDTKMQVFHNIANVNMKEKKYDQAVAAYKNSLRLNPSDEETRYNLALAKKLLKDQQQQNKDDKNKDKDKNKDENKDKNEQNKDNKKDQGDDKEKDKDKKEGDDNKDKQDKDKGGNNEQKEKPQPKPQPNKLSQQQIQQLLDAMNNEENKTQKKVNAKKARGKKTKNEKDW